MFFRKNKLNILEANLWNLAKQHKKMRCTSFNKNPIKLDVIKTMDLIQHYQEKKDPFKISQSDSLSWQIVTIAAALCLIILSILNLVIKPNNSAQFFSADYVDDYDISLLL